MNLKIFESYMIRCKGENKVPTWEGLFQYVVRIKRLVGRENGNGMDKS